METAQSILHTNYKKVKWCIIKKLISVKGQNKFEENQTIEVVYEGNKEKLTYKFYKMYVNDEADGGLATLLKKSADDLDTQKNK